MNLELERWTMPQSGMRSMRAGRQLGLLTGAAALVAAPVGFALLASEGPAAAAVTLTVDSLGDGSAVPADCTTPVPGACSLRDALSAAADGDTIDFASGLSGTISLSSELFVNVGVTIAGPGADVLTVHQTSFHRIFEVGVLATDVVISGLTLDGEGASGNGGTIRAYNAGSFTLDSVSVTGSSSTGSGGGLFLFSRDDIVIRNSTIDGSSSLYGEGGGLAVRGNGRSISIVGSTISNNSAGESYAGGGIAILGSGNQVTIANSTITGNSAGRGGGIVAGDDNTFTFAMSTISANASTSTVVGVGHGGGIAFEEPSLGDGAALSATLIGDIVSANTSVGSPSAADVTDARGAMTITVSDSLIGLASPFTNAGGTIFSSTPGLAALAANGGPTKTMALLTGSFAIGAGPSVIPSFLGNEWDQRGVPYLRRVGTRSDIGAYEEQILPTPPTPDPDGDRIMPSFTG